MSAQAVCCDKAVYVGLYVCPVHDWQAEYIKLLESVEKAANKMFTKPMSTDLRPLKDSLLALETFRKSGGGL